jgi:hypothetical protein
MGNIHLPIKVVVTFRDAKETESSTYIHLLPAVSFADAFTFGEAYASALELASDAQVTGIQIIAESVSDSFNRPPLSSDVYRVGTLIFGTTTPDERWILSIPSLRTETLFSSGPYAGIQIDLTLPSVDTLATAIIDGYSPVTPTGLTGNDISSVIIGLLQIP